LLGFKNVAAGSTPLSGDPDKTPYSLEELVKNDPELIFITSMGTDAAIENRLRSDVQSNPAWNSLKAVRENRIIFCRNSYF
jgi:iron complex transport system substrate-binding protein